MLEGMAKRQKQLLKERIIKLENYVFGDEENQPLKEIFQNELKFAREELKRMEE